MFVKIVEKSPKGNIQTTQYECEKFRFVPDEDREDGRTDVFNLTVWINPQSFGEALRHVVISGKKDVYVLNNKGETIDCLYRHMNDK